MLTLQETLILCSCDYKKLVKRGGGNLTSDNYVKIVTNIKNILNEKGLKQGFVAEKAGFTDQQFSNILNFRKQLKVEHIPRIAYGLGVEPNEIFK